MGDLNGARVAVVFNDGDHGSGPERESRADVVRVAAAVHDALAARGVATRLVAVGDDLLDVLAALDRDRPDVVFNLCESIGTDSRTEPALPALLDVLGLPYTGSGPLALGLALRKDKAKQILAACGIATPAFAVVASAADLGGEAVAALGFPLIVKPAREDASVGIGFDSVVADAESLARAAKVVLDGFRQPALVERYVDGRELYVPILGGEVLPLTEIRFGEAFEDRPRIVTYAAKWEPHSREFRDSPTCPAIAGEAVLDCALRAFEALGCRDYGRVDVRLPADGEPFVIDVNPNCDLGPDGGFALSAARAGIGYGDLVLRLVELARARAQGASVAPRGSPPSGSRSSAR